MDLRPCTYVYVSTYVTDARAHTHVKHISFTLQVNNVAAIGGEEAIIALTSCEELLVTLITLLCDAIKRSKAYHSHKMFL